MSSKTRAFVQIHLCVLLWGFTAVLGRLITLSSWRLVYFRMLLSAGVLVLLPRFWRGASQIPRRLLGVYAGIGAVVCLHWLSFYGSVKLANASVAASCLALAPVFTALLAPCGGARRLDFRELSLGVLAVPGVVLVVGGTPAAMHQGILAGMLAAASGAWFTVLNARYASASDPLAVTGIEMAAGAVLLAFAGLLMPSAEIFVWPGPRDGLWLLVLALGCTLLPFALWLVSLRQLSAFATTLISSLEPVYAMALAAVLLGEQQTLHPRFYAGAAILISVVVVHPLLIRSDRTQPAVTAAQAGEEPQ